VTYFIGHIDEALEYEDGSDCASTTYWTDGEVEYDSDDDVVQDVADLAADGDTIHLCAGVWEFDAVVNTAIADVSIVGDGIDETIVDGGAVYNPGGERTSTGTMLFAAATIPLLADMTIQHGGDDGADQGAVFAEEATIEGVHFYRNEAEEVGGALVVDTANIRDSSFLENYAGEYGGAIYALGDVTLNQSTFTSNVANLGGGAVAVLGNLVSRDSEFSENSVLLFEEEVSSGGGAIFVAGEATISGGSFVDNFGAWGGGAIYAANSGDPLSISGVSFEGNTTLQAGGAIVAVGPTTISRSTFHENSSSSGGAIFALYELLSLDRTTFTDNVATGDVDFVFGECMGGGGAILSVGQVATSRSTFSGNRALIPAERELDDCLESTGLALLLGTGGAISSLGYVQSSADRFIGNLAHVWGGAIVSFAGIVGGIVPDGLGVTRITGSTFDSNTAGSSTVAALDFDLGSVGGAFVQLGGNLTIERSRFTRNQTGNAGGAIVYQGLGAETRLRLLRNTISGNRAGVPEFTTPDLPTYGGGLFLLFTNGDSRQVEISRNTITGNSSGDFGGGAYIVTQTLEGMQQNVIRSNSAVRGGGLALATCEARSRRVEATLRSTNQISRNWGSVDRDLMFDAESIFCFAPD
jgi:predicted outer membrane repeat protein